MSKDINELNEICRAVRRDIVTMVHMAGSGHPGGSLSSTELMVGLYFGDVIKVDPKNPDWDGRDRFILSKGHVAPVIYSILARKGFFPMEELGTLRKLGSRLQGHPHAAVTPGFDCSAGSLGQGLSIATGLAMGFRKQNKPNRVYCLLGDGELQEGQVWEAVMTAAHHRLDNLCAIVDWNHVQLDGTLEDIKDMGDLIAKWRDFGWNVIELNGHDIGEVLKAYEAAQSYKGGPSVLIAHCVKGKGVSFMENDCNWHGNAPNKEQLEKALSEIGGVCEWTDKVKPAEKTAPKTEVKKIPMRDGYGQALMELCEKKENIMVLDADVAKSTRTVWIRDKYPEYFTDMGISEQDMIGTAAGLALSGITPFASTYCVFLSGRAWDQIRTTVCYNNLNVKLGGAHAGISVGPDGATHQSLEDIALMRVLPNMTVIAPCDSEETRKATLAIAKKNGPCFVRFGREAVPVVTDENTPFEIGKARICREGSDVTVIACGAMVYEALQAAEELKGSVSVRVINMHTIKPLDEAAVIAAAKETGCIVTAEEHQMAGGLGSAVAECLAKNIPCPLEMVAINDSFGESGQPEELMNKYRLNKDAIIEKIRRVTGRK